MKHFDLHECPECGGDGRKRGYTCDLCDASGFVSEEEWRLWCDFQADREQQHYEAERRAK